MIGDDIVSDVGGAQACGIRGVQVRTGKFRYVYQRELLMPFILHGCRNPHFLASFRRQHNGHSDKSCHYHYYVNLKYTHSIQRLNEEIFLTVLLI